VNDTRIQTADGCFADFNDLGAGIQQDGHKIFLLFAVKLVFHQRGNIDGIFNDLLIICRRIAFQTVRQFKGRFDLTGFGQSDASDLRKLFDGSLCQPFQSIKLTEQTLRRHHHGFAGNAASQYHRQ